MFSSSSVSLWTGFCPGSTHQYSLAELSKGEGALYFVMPKRKYVLQLYLVLFPEAKQVAKYLLMGMSMLMLPTLPFGDPSQ